MWTHIPKSGPVLSWIFCCRCCWLRTCLDLAWIWQCCFTVAHHSCRSQWLRRTLFQTGTAGSRRLSSALIWHLQTLDLMFVTFCDLWSILKIFEMLAMLAGNNSNAEAQLGIRASSKFWLTLVDVGRIGQTCGGKVVPVPSGWTHCTLLALYTCITSKCRICRMQHKQKFHGRIQRDTILWRPTDVSLIHLLFPLVSYIYPFAMWYWWPQPCVKFGLKL